MKVGLFEDTHPANWYSPNSFSASDAALPWATTAKFLAPIQIAVPESSTPDALTTRNLQNWPAGPLAPPQLPVPPTADWIAS
jgi:hypothetical protein